MFCQGVGPLIFKISKFQVITVFVTVMLLRIVVGYHFFKEGTSKLKSDNFTSKGFLTAAKGPFAPWFKGMVEDYDYAQRLCVSKEKTPDGAVKYSVDSKLTDLLWNDYLNRVTAQYELGSQKLQEKFQEQRETLAEQIRTARATRDESVDVAQLEFKRAVLEAKILKLRSQREDAETILTNHLESLNEWLDANQVELLGHFESADRLEGFEQDGRNRQQAALFVDTLRYQVDTIRTDRNKRVQGWANEVTGIWDSYENQIQNLLIEEQLENAAPLEAHRPFDESLSFHKVVDLVIPWFDTIIGVSLIIGLFCRFTSLAAAAFLFSVIMTQPPWVPGTQPTYFYAIELFALLVIFAMHAGRLGGLDYFLNPALYPKPQNAADPDANSPNTIPATSLEG